MNRGLYGFSHIEQPPSYAGTPPQTMSPDDVPDLRGWLKADTLAPLSDGSQVAAWNDARGVGITCTQGTAANRPFFYNDVRNGLPAVRSDKTNDFFTVGGITTSSTEHTCIFAMRKHSSDAGLGYLLSSSTGTGIGITLAWITGGAQTGPLWGNAPNNWTFGDGLPFEWTILTAVWSAEFSYLYRNGVMVGSGAAGTIGFSGDICLFKRHSTATNYSGVELGEFCYFDRALTHYEHVSIANYMNARYLIY